MLAIPLLLLATSVATASASAAAAPYDEHVFDTYHDPNDYIHNTYPGPAARVKVSLYVMSRCPDAVSEAEIS